MTRQEARERIGLGIIPDEKIEQIIKVKKDKLKTNNAAKSDSKSSQRNTVATTNTRMDGKVRPASTSKESERQTTSAKLRTVITTQTAPTHTTVKTKIPEPTYQFEMSSSINDMDDYLPVYGKSQYKHSDAKKSKNSVKTSGEKHLQKATEQTEAEKVIQSQCRKDLVKIQKLNRIRKLKEQREKNRQEEERKRQNLEALESVIKKKSEVYKKKKDVPDRNNDSIGFDNQEQLENQRFTAEPSVHVQDNFKLGQLSSQKPITKVNTTKNSGVNSVCHSAQSPLSRRTYNNEVKGYKKSSIGDESTTASHVNNFNGRLTYEPKFKNKRGSVTNSINMTKQSKKLSKYGKCSNTSKVSIKSKPKQVKKVISIPSVEIDKKAAKSLKKTNYFDLMDTIPENHDMSEGDNASVNYQLASTKSKPKSSQKIKSSGRKVIISKVNSTQKSKESALEPKLDKPKHKKLKTKGKGKHRTYKSGYGKVSKSRPNESYQQSIDEFP